MTCAFAGRIIARGINGERGPLVVTQFPVAQAHVIDCDCEVCTRSYQRLEDAGWPNVTEHQPV